MSGFDQKKWREFGLSSTAIGNRKTIYLLIIVLLNVDLTCTTPRLGAFLDFFPVNRLICFIIKIETKL